MIRNFSTSAAFRAIARAPRMAARPATRARPAAAPKSGANPKASTTTTTTTSSSASPVASATAQALQRDPPSSRPTASVSPSGPRTGASQSTGVNGPAPTPNFNVEPSLVPELHTQPTTTPVADTVDQEQVVNNLASLEVSEGLGEDWTTSFQGLGQKPFDRQAIDILMAPVVPEDVEITPDGLLYLPEIKYRRILNRAFGPGGWGIAPRTKTLVTKRQVTREYGLVCLGRLVSVSRGEMDFFSAEGVTTAMEGCKSNALMRCCKDLGIASELWDPTFIRQFKQKNCDSKYFEKKRRFVWKRKDRAWEYPYN